MQLLRALNALVDAKEVIRTGAGNRTGPYLYAVARGYHAMRRILGPSGVLGDLRDAWFEDHAGGVDVFEDEIPGSLQSLAESAPGLLQVLVD